MKADIGIIGAMAPEVEGLISLLDEHTSETVGGIVMHTGRLFDKRIAIAQCGVGKVFAAMCAEAMILRYQPALLVNTGVGGAVASGLSTGDIVIAESLCQHDMDTTAIGDEPGLISGINRVYFDTDRRAAQLLLSAAQELSLPARLGRIATGDTFVASAEERERIAGTFSASVCEMEGGAVAQVAAVNGTPFIVVRAISDSADGEATMDYPTFLPLAAKNSTSLTLALIRSW